MKKIRVYPVGRYRGITRTVVDSLRSSGFLVVHNWAEADSGDEDHSEHGRGLTAATDVWAATHCEFLLMMWTDGMKGAFWEAGLAQASGGKVVVVGANKGDCIFFYHPDVLHADSLKDAIRIMKEHHGKT